MEDWHIRSIDMETVRRIRTAATSHGTTIARYLSWISTRLPEEWDRHATNCGACGGYIEGLDEDEDGCRDGCPLH